MTLSRVSSTFRSTLRGLRKNPGFLAVAVLTLAVGIGANVALFTVVDSVLLQPLPYTDPERLVAVLHTAPGLGLDRIGQSDATYLFYRKHGRTLEHLGVYHGGFRTLTGEGEPERVGTAWVTGPVFQAVRVPPALGRALADADGRPGAEPVAVLSHGLWRRRFAGRPDAVGATLQLDGVAHRVVGVMPEGFAFPPSAGSDIELWVPLEIDPAALQEGNMSYSAVARLRPGATPERAAEELSALVRRVHEEVPGFEPGMVTSARLAAVVLPLKEQVVGEVAQALWLLLGSVGLILLIACANVANLFLVRAEGRQREVAVHTALGASRGDVARLFLSEGIALALLGGALGLALAAAGIRALVALEPSGLPRLDEIGVGATALAFTAGLTLLAGLFLGAFACLRYGTPDLVPALKEGGRGSSAGRARHRARRVLVVTQVALALVLLLGSGLMAKSFWRLMSVDPGLDPAGILTLHLDLPAAEYRTVEAAARFHEQLLGRVRALPGVAAAGTTSLLPLSGQNSQSSHAIEGQPLSPGAPPPMLGIRFASPGYLQAMGIPLLEGRAFDRLDPRRAEDGVLVSANIARRFWPGQSALGKRLGNGEPDDPESGDRWFTVVGVVGDVREQGLHAPAAEAVYYPLVSLSRPEEEEGWTSRSFTLVVRGRGVEPAALAGPVRQAIRELDRNLPVVQARSMEEVVERSAARTSFTMLLLMIAAATALLLGSVGIYGVISYVVSQRTREIGVRMALGAARWDISRMVLGEGLALVVAGTALGLAAAFALTRSMVALLFEVSPTDPATFAMVPALLAAVALLASWLPAQRAARVEPLSAIRSE